MGPLAWSDYIHVKANRKAAVFPYSFMGTTIISLWHNSGRALLNGQVEVTNEYNRMAGTRKSDHHIRAQTFQ